MKLAGKIEIAAPAERVWVLINDPISLAGCVPGGQDVRQIDDRTFGGSITAAVGPMEGRFEFSAVIERSDFPADLVVEMTGVDSVTRSTLVASIGTSLEFVDADRTTLVYTATINVKGRLAILGDMILRATARVMISELVKCLRSRLEPAAGAGTGARP